MHDLFELVWKFPFITQLMILSPLMVLLLIWLLKPKYNPEDAWTVEWQQRIDWSWKAVRREYPKAQRIPVMRGVFAELIYELELVTGNPHEFMKMTSAQRVVWLYLFKRIAQLV